MIQPHIHTRVLLLRFGMIKSRLAKQHRIYCRNRWRNCEDEITITRVCVTRDGGNIQRELSNEDRMRNNSRVTLEEMTSER
ncbi:hypothetical protein L596_022940 [Steinernema carpocapsae]|uniref:Uncharacterized protein n=1 Tax=Steinernema carpocapsae TaxID=34508 RepID=A0A4U5MCZ7_STECR|nr:hypothetical protein L596_022940 [Steinernema carpocapsae]